MNVGDKVIVPSTVKWLEEVNGVIIDIYDLPRGICKKFFPYMVKTNEGVSFYAEDEIKSLKES